MPAKSDFLNIELSYYKNEYLHYYKLSFWLFVMSTKITLNGYPYI